MAGILARKNMAQDVEVKRGIVGDMTNGPSWTTGVDAGNTADGFGGLDNSNCLDGNGIAKAFILTVDDAGSEDVRSDAPLLTLLGDGVVGCYGGLHDCVWRLLGLLNVVQVLVGVEQGSIRGCAGMAGEDFGTCGMQEMHMMTILLGFHLGQGLDEVEGSFWLDCINEIIYNVDSMFDDVLSHGGLVVGGESQWFCTISLYGFGLDGSADQSVEFVVWR